MITLHLEPTTGLDSSIAYEVIEKVKKLVDDKRVCLITIHQPSHEIFDLFNRTILVHAGRVIYSGPTKNVFLHFNSLGFQHKPSSNPAEFIISICSDPNTSAEELEKLFRGSSFYTPPEVGIVRANKMKASQNTSGEISSRYRQFSMLMSRGWNQNVRDLTSLKTEFYKHLFFAIVIGATFFQQAHISYPFNEKEIDDFTGLIFFTIMFFWYSNTQCIPALASMDQLYRRELAASAYAEFPYWAATILTKLPFLLLFFTLFFIIWYLMCGFQLKAAYFFFFWIVLFLGSISSFFYSLLFAAASGNAVIAFAIVPPLSVFMGLFSGFPIYIRDIPSGWREWGSLFSSWRWVFQGLVMYEFNVHAETNSTDLYADVSTLYFRDDGTNSNFSEYWIIWILIIYLLCVSFFMYVGMLKATNRLVKVTPTDDALDPNLLLLRASIIVAREGNFNPILLETKSTLEARDREKGLTGCADEITEEIVKNELRSEKMKPRQSVLSMFSRRGDLDVEGPAQNKSTNLEDFRASMAITKDDRNACEGIQLDFSNLSYSVTRENDNSVLQLLSNINGTILPGKMCALMGASGAGKSTLLDVLAGRKNVGTISGDILFDGVERNASLSRNMAYVMQDDLHIPNLTVKETLYFAAELRMDESETVEAKIARVDKVMTMLLLSDVENAIVGGGLIRGLPGGKRRRVSIGVEIVNFPRLLFLDGKVMFTCNFLLTEISCFNVQQNRLAVSTARHLMKYVMRLGY